MLGFFKHLKKKLKEFGLNKKSGVFILFFKSLVFIHPLCGAVAVVHAVHSSVGT